MVGAPAGEYGDRPSLPAGFQPAESISDATLPDVTPQRVRAMTSGGSTGQPKLILDLTPAQCDPEQAENGMQERGTTLVPGPLYHAGPFITACQQLLCGGTVVLMSRRRRTGPAISDNQAI